MLAHVWLRNMVSIAIVVVVVSSLDFWSWQWEVSSWHGQVCIKWFLCNQQSVLGHEQRMPGVDSEFKVVLGLGDVC